MATSSSALFAQQSSSAATRTTQPVQAAQPTPSPAAETHKRRSIPEVEDAMARGQELLFKKHDARASIDEFKRAAKLDPWYGQAYMLLGLAQMQLQQWSEAQWAFEEAAKVEPGNAKAYLGAGSALNEQKNYVEAQKALEWANGRVQNRTCARPSHSTRTMPDHTRSWAISISSKKMRKLLWRNFKNVCGSIPKEALRLQSRKLSLNSRKLWAKNKPPAAIVVRLPKRSFCCQKGASAFRCNTQLPFGTNFARVFR
jgi:tetratricopeptide (TPR) repeat protein